MSASAKRLLAAGLLVLAVLVVVVLGGGASGSGGTTYRVRAIFDNASFIVPGEDVKVAGVKVGAVDSLDVTADHKAVIVLRIDDAAFQDFKRDATCTIRLQSLIGEKFVACVPTQPHDANAQPVPALRQITKGPGKGQYLLPVTSTSSPVDVDLLNDIMRVPERQRFSIILNELGVGLSGNGKELRAVVRRANPALQQFDRVLAILASQNRVLANLATESDAALAPIARRSASIVDFIDKSGRTAAATAERGDALEQSFAKFPAFLTQLTPTAQRLGEFASAATPVFANLRTAAPSIDRLFEQLGPFSTAALPTFRTLGNLSDVGRQALTHSQPVINDIATLGAATKPLASNLARALTKLKGQHGIERLLDIILFTTGAGNGFSSVNHYLRAFLTLQAQCTTYVAVQLAGCASTFDQSGSAAAATAGANAGNVAATTPTPPAGGSLTDVASSPDSGGSGASPAPAPQPPAGLLSYLLGNGGAR